MRKVVLGTVAGVLLMAASVCWPGIPHLIHYQGMLTDDAGNPLNTPQDLTFRIYNVESGGSSLWGETQNGVPVTDGLFSVLLGSVRPIDLSFDEDYWLEIEVSVYDTLLPRMKLASVGYAYRAEWADTADWSDTSDYSFQAERADTAEWSDTSDYTLKSQMADTANYAFAGPGVTDNDWLFRITDTGDTTITTGGAWGIARYGNTLYGNADSTHVNLGVACTTGRSGQDFPYCTIGGGLQNSASEAAASVGGGMGNTASGVGATVAGGGFSIASKVAAYVGGGEGNTASGGHATVGGGYQNTASDSLATVGGGTENTADSMAATVAGGVHNSASKVAATVAGGGFNTASGGGAFVGGGEANTASGEIAAVAGGSSNIASGKYATVPGGVLNTASGNYSFAAGRRAKANHHGTFVWADSTDADFT